MKQTVFSGVVLISRYMVDLWIHFLDVVSIDISVFYFKVAMNFAKIPGIYVDAVCIGRWSNIAFELDT